MILSKLKSNLDKWCRHLIEIDKISPPSLRKENTSKVPAKKGIRILVVAESFRKGQLCDKSVMVGAVIRQCTFLEALRFSLSTLMGLDATDVIIKIYNDLQREDINLILLSGVIVSLYNIIDINRLYDSVRKPIIAISYRESKGLEDTLSKLPMGDKRLEIYKENGERIKVLLKNGFSLYIRCVGLDLNDAIRILNMCTKFGRLPEPVKVAKSLARGILESLITLQIVKKTGNKYE